VPSIRNQSFRSRFDTKKDMQFVADGSFISDGLFIRHSFMKSALLSVRHAQFQKTIIESHHAE
jgi:hypothetical protein